MSAVATPAPPPALPTTLPLQALQAGLFRFTVAQYHDLIRRGMLTEDDNVEMLEGYLVHKMSRNPPHDSTLHRLARTLTRILPDDWQARDQLGVTLADSEPEPDIAVVRGTDHTYDFRHAGAADFGIVIEVADSSLAGDRVDKGRIYARANIPEYWVVNVIDGQIEVYTDPQPGPPPAYATRTDYRPGSTLPLVLDGVTIATLAVDDLLP